MRREESSRRDLMIVAQYEVLGNSAKDTSVPPETIEVYWLPGPLVCGFTSVSNRRSSRSSFVILTMADRPGRPVF
jgi:hypothetical protein